MSIETYHDSTGTYRRVTTDDGETHDFEIVGDEGSADGYDYQGEGEVPEAVAQELLAWIEEHHGEPESDGAE